MKSANNWPESDYESMVNFYGEVGDNSTKLHLPYPMSLSWNPAYRVNSITVHEKVAESMDRVLSTVLELYGIDRIQMLGLDQWGGCKSVRKKRGGTSWSTHAWAAANDWLPSENGLHTPWEKSRFSNPQYIDFLNAWIFEGWEPLGLSWGRDSMHIQATANDVQPLATNLLLAA